MTTTLHPPDLPRSTDFRNHEEGPCGTVNCHLKVDDDMFGDAQPLLPVLWKDVEGCLVSHPRGHSYGLYDQCVYLSSNPTIAAYVQSLLRPLHIRACATALPYPRDAESVHSSSSETEDISMFLSHSAQDQYHSAQGFVNPHHHQPPHGSHHLSHHPHQHQHLTQRPLPRKPLLLCLCTVRVLNQTTL